MYFLSLYNLYLGVIIDIFIIIESILNDNDFRWTLKFALSLKKKVSQF